MNLLKEGKTDELPALLGRFYTTSGIVVHGDKRGRTIGFPTANVDINDEYIFPPTWCLCCKNQIVEALVRMVSAILAINQPLIRKHKAFS